jgi:mono/diheme cytochrome c family protein
MSLDAGGFLAVCNMPSSNSTFSKVIKGGVVIDPSPLYLVWTNTLAREMPWPYKISKIKVYTSGGVLAAAAPLSSNTAVTNGFNIFCRHCATCHSIRGSGGKLGIDLGAPLNVTAYWRTDVLRQLIRNPASVRDNAKMPAFPNLNQNDIDAIIKYLKFMKKNSPSSKPVLN